MATEVERKALISRGASDAAFRAGQRLGRLLTERGLQIALSGAVETVTAEHLKICIDESFLRTVRAELLAALDGGSEFEQRNAA